MKEKLKKKYMEDKKNFYIDKLKSLDVGDFNQFPDTIKEIKYLEERRI